MQFNSDQHPSQDFRPLHGRYRVEVEDAVNAATKSGRGEQLTIKLRVLGPTDDGRVVFARFTTRHDDSEAAQRIGLGQLSDASRALGRPQWRSESELIGCRCEVDLEPDGDFTRARRWHVRQDASNPYRDAARAPQSPPQSPPPKYDARPKQPPMPEYAPPPTDDDIPF